jgi:branched-chain amino acid transport system substrate-binding protein
MRRRKFLLTSLCLPSGLALVRPAAAEQKYGPGVTDTEIKIGQTMPYSGPASAASVIGKAELAYFRMLNEKGGINGRRITLISLDDGFSPPKTVEQTRRLVEQEQVLALMGSFGSATNAAIQRYLTNRKVPQLFIAAGASRWNDPVHFPWTMPLVVALRSEAKAHAAYVLASNPNARVAVLYQNDDFGKDYVDGVKEKFGAHATERVAAMASHELTDPTVESQIIALKASGADTLFLATTPKFTTQAIRTVFDIGWHPARFITVVSSSVAAVLAPAGLERSKGVMAVATAKSVSDPQWQDDPEYRDWLAFMRKYYPDGDVGDQFALVGYGNAVLFAEVLRRCGDDLTRDHLMQVATHLNGLRMPMLLPGITLNTSPTDYHPIKQMRLQRFDSHKWELVGDLIEE